MALHMRLMVNEREIGSLVVQRRAWGRRAGVPKDDDFCYYDWRLRINGKTLVNRADHPLVHLYGDGAWVLVDRVIRAALDISEEFDVPALVALYESGWAPLHRAAGDATA